MAEAVDALAFDVRDRADAGHVEVAHDHRHAHGRAGQEGRVALFLGDIAANGAALHGNHAEFTDRFTQQSETAGRHSRSQQRSAQRHHGQDAALRLLQGRATASLKSWVTVTVS